MTFNLNESPCKHSESTRERLARNLMRTLLPVTTGPGNVPPVAAALATTALRSQTTVNLYHTEEERDWDARAIEAIWSNNFIDNVHISNRPNCCIGWRERRQCKKSRESSHAWHGRKNVIRNEWREINRQRDTEDVLGDLQLLKCISDPLTVLAERWVRSCTLSLLWESGVQEFHYQYNSIPIGLRVPLESQSENLVLL